MFVHRCPGYVWLWKPPVKQFWAAVHQLRQRDTAMLHQPQHLQAWASRFIYTHLQQEKVLFIIITGHTIHVRLTGKFWNTFFFTAFHAHIGMFYNIHSMATFFSVFLFSLLSNQRTLSNQTTNWICAINWNLRIVSFYYHCNTVLLTAFLSLEDWFTVTRDMIA